MAQKTPSTLCLEKIKDGKCSINPVLPASLHNTGNYHSKLRLSAAIYVQIKKKEPKFYSNVIKNVSVLAVMSLQQCLRCVAVLFHSFHTLSGDGMFQDPLDLLNACIQRFKEPIEIVSKKVLPTTYQR